MIVYERDQPQMTIPPRIRIKAYVKVRYVYEFCTISNNWTNHTSVMKSLVCPIGPSVLWLYIDPALGLSLPRLNSRVPRCIMGMPPGPIAKALAGRVTGLRMSSGIWE